MVTIPDPMPDAFGRTVLRQQVFPLDERTLQQIAEATGGKYFRAQDAEQLEDVYAEIDRLEKSPSEGRLYSEYRELYQWFLLPGLGLIVVQVVLAGRGSGVCRERKKLGVRRKNGKSSSEFCLPAHYLP